jgi:hypothetical protein
MTRLAPKLLSATLAVAAVAAAPARARADNAYQSGYVCTVRTSWNTAQSNGYNIGTDGYTEIELYSAPNCGGSYVGASYIMTSGATLCPSNTTASGAAMQAAVSTLATARVNGWPVEIDWWPGSYDGVDCASQISLVGAPPSP